MHPILIAGAALVGLPILLHLIMKQEPKRLTFPAFRFLTQKLKTNQRKLRVRHLILLALRMLLIALFCLALYQPTLKSDRLNIRGEQPVATVLVVDTSPSMGFVANDKTRLDEARRRVLEFLDELPDKSPVAVVTTDDPGGGYWQDLADARKLVEQLDQPRGGGQPVTAALAQAYRLLSAVEARDGDGGEALPKLVAVFTDRAAASWDPGRADDLKKLRDAVPDPKPAHAVVDVGADAAVNVGLTGAEMKPQVVTAGQPAPVTVTVAAAGPPDLPPFEAVVLAKLDGSDKVADRKLVKMRYGQSQAVTFEFRGLKPGLHQVQFELESRDKLMFDNFRFLTFKVGEAKRVLTVTDDPKAALYWQAGLGARRDLFTAVAVTPAAVRTAEGGRTVVDLPDPEKPGGKPLEQDLQEFDVVCLLSVETPNRPAGNTLWDKLRSYVLGGGKLVVIPGDRAPPEEYAAGGDLMPATLKEVVDTGKVGRPLPDQLPSGSGWPAARPGKNGVTWFLDDKVVQHPMLRPFQEWRAKGNVDVVKFPRVAWRYWAVDKAPEGAVVVRYHDAEKEADRSPAVLERGVADPKEPGKVRGRVVLLTTKLEPTDVTDEGKNWHNYWASETSWGAVFPWLVCRYLAGDVADANFNFPAGQVVTVPLPKGGVPRGKRVVISGPGIPSAESLLDVGDRQTELPVGPPKTNQPGNFKLEVDADALKWRDGFSLNVPAEEGALEKVPAEAVEDLTGKGTVFPLDKGVKLRDVIPVILDQPVDLFPWLLILVLLLLAAEGVVANRFYRRVR
ncbi:MAG: hypothetical protein C0501_17070 [Isosphaera sp.]|nr:hypothetical protein [Isosphaera sp.]